MKNILIPVDFSPLSLKALDFALKLAQEASSKVFILNTFVTPYDFASRLDLVLNSYKKDSEKRLKDLMESLKTKKDSVGLELVSYVEVGEIVSVVEKFVKEHSINLVVMGTQGASGIKKTLIGSNTAELLKHCACPVLAIPDKAKFTKINSFIYATDYQENDLLVIRQIIEWRKYFNAKLHTLHIAKTKNFETEVRFAGYKDYLKKKEEFTDIKHHLVINNDPEQGITEFTKNRKNSILVVVPHKKSIWESFFGKSLSVTLSYHTHLPILALRLP